MNFGEIKLFVKSQIRENTTELDALMELQANLAYRRFSRMALWPDLRMDDESLTAIGSTRFYTAPYPIDRLIAESMRYDVTSTQPGSRVLVTDGNETQFFRASTASTITPQSVSITGSGGIGDLYNTGTIAIANRSTAVTGTGTTFIAAHVGEWIVFHEDSTGNNGGDYGYKIAAVGSVTGITLSTAYRGPTLAGARYSIRPGNTRRLVFDPLFTENGKVIKYAWQRKPARLYNSEDLPEVEELSDAIAWQVIALQHAHHENRKDADFAFGQSRSDFTRAKALLQ